MADYRLYCLQGNGKFTAVHEIEADDDADALLKARAMKLPDKCELWLRSRLVAMLDGCRQ